MKKSAAQIAEGLKQLCSVKPQVIVAIVKSVDEQKYSMICTPVDGGADYVDVRLKAAIDGEVSGVVEIPAVGSTVLLSTIGNDPDTLYMLATSKVARIYIKTTNSEGNENGSLIIENGEFVFNYGGGGGMIKMDVFMEVLNRLENRVISLITVMNTHTHAETGAVTAPQPTQIGAYGAPTQRNNIENTKVRHG